MTELHHYQGVYAATVCPMDASGHHIDEVSLASHLRSVAEVKGIRGLLINGHAGENVAITREEKCRVIQLARQVCPANSLLIAGINAEDSFDAQAQADEAKANGADAILLFPPYSWTLSTDEQTVINHHNIVNANAQLPLMLYQAGVGTGGMAYSPDLLKKLVCLPHVVAVKEGSWETATYEANLRMIREVAPHVEVMASGDEHLFTCFTLGTDGSQVSLAAVVPELVVALYDAVKAQNLPEAQRLHQFVYPLAKAIYGTRPGTHANARLKACLHLQGKIPNAMLRPPVPQVAGEELEQLARVLAYAETYSRTTLN